MGRKTMAETVDDLVKRWRERAASLRSGDPVSELAAYHLRFAADELAGIKDDMREKLEAIVRNDPRFG